MNTRQAKKARRMAGSHNRRPLIAVIRDRALRGAADEDFL